MVYLAEEKRILFQKQLAEPEAALKKSGLNFVIVQSPFFQDNVVGFKDGVYLPLRDGAMSSPSVYDLGRTLAHILENPQPHFGKTYELTGPSLIHGKDVAQAMSEVTGKEVPYIDVPPSEAKKAFLGYG